LHRISLVPGRDTLDILQAIFYISEAWRELPDSVIQNCWQHANIIPRTAQEIDYFISHREFMEYTESGAQTAIESLLDVDCNLNSEQTANTARQFVLYDEDMPDPNVPTSAVDLDELIDDLMHPESEDPEPLIIREPESLPPVISYETAQRHLTELSRYFTMLPIHEIEIPFSRTPFKITTGVSQLHRLKEVIGHQHENQKKQSDLAKCFTVTAGP
jgi:hypothetical protein